MNRSKSALGIAMITAAAFGLRPSSLAAEGENTQPTGMSPTAGAEAEGAAPHGGGRMMEALGLSPQQASQFKAERKQHREAMMALRDKLKDALGKLETEVDSKASDSDISATLDALGAARKDLEAEQARFMTAVKAFLSPMQQAQVLLMEMRMMATEMSSMRGKAAMPAGEGQAPGGAGK
jgi:Spy/CpxP family protein refolding chaperone